MTQYCIIAVRCHSGILTFEVLYELLIIPAVISSIHACFACECGGRQDRKRRAQAPDDARPNFEVIRRGGRLRP